MNRCTEKARCSRVPMAIPSEEQRRRGSSSPVSFLCTCSAIPDGLRDLCSSSSDGDIALLLDGIFYCAQVRTLCLSREAERNLSLLGRSSTDESRQPDLVLGATVLQAVTRPPPDTCQLCYVPYYHDIMQMSRAIGNRRTRTHRGHRRGAASPPLLL